MSVLTKRAFTSTNINTNSNTITNQFQGGGDKKAGFPYQVGRIWWTSIAIQTCNPMSSVPCCTLTRWNTTKLPMANISRPIGSTLTPNPYWRLTGGHITGAYNH
jgi:hypothetical protein